MDNGFLVCGDTHGNHRYISHKIKTTGIENTTIFHVGDFGVGFQNEHTDRDEMVNLNTTLAKYNCHLYVIRGNHDDPAYFDGSWEWSNLHLVPDYTVVTVNGDDVLMVGGAISVDRLPRKRDIQHAASKGRDIGGYWYDEGFVLDADKLQDIKGVRYVITHSCPMFVMPINNFDNKYSSHGMFVEHFVIDGDTKLKDDLNNERVDISLMYEILKDNNLIDKWFYGHYHDSNAMYYEDTDFVMLNINEFKEVRQS